MAIVRVLRAYRGFPCGVYCDATGAALKEGVNAGAFDDKAQAPEGVELFELPAEPEAEVETPAKPADKKKK